MGKVFAFVTGLVVAAGGVFLLAWILWLLWKRDSKEEDSETAIEIATSQPSSAAEPVPEEAESVNQVPPPGESVVQGSADEETPIAGDEPLEPDDLKRIEGIGPKLSSVLQEAGIETFAQLADTDTERLRQILEQADPRLLRLAKPDSWPEQASLADAGEWEALEAYQKELKS